MGVKIRERDGAWWLFIDHQGKRKAKRIGTGKAGKKAAELAATKIAARLAEGGPLVLDPPARPVRVPTLAEYAKTWLGTLETRTRPSTLDDYRIRLRVRILPFIGSLPLTEITRERVRSFIRELATRGNQRKRAETPCPLSRATLKGTLHVLGALLARAVEDGLISANPAQGLVKEIAAPVCREVAEVEVFTPEELSRLLAVAEQEYPEWHPFILCLARSGVRLGEAIGLEWGDVDFERPLLIIRRSERRGRVSVPKNGKARRVDMSRQLGHVLSGLKTLQEAEAALAGKMAPERVFPMPDGAAIRDDAFRNNIWASILRRAGLRYRKPHALRHTYASLLIEGGESLKYVQEQLGHHSPAFTLAAYGHLIPRGDRRAVDRLDDTTGRNPGAIDIATLDTLVHDLGEIHPSVSNSAL